MILRILINKNVYLCTIRNEYSYTMELNALIAECTAYDFKVMLEEKKPKSWLKSVSAFANGLGGSLFFGIDNDGIVRGLDDVQHVCEAISSKIRDYMDPLPEVEMIPHDIDGLHILQLSSVTPSLYYRPADGVAAAIKGATLQWAKESEEDEEETDGGSGTGGGTTPPGSDLEG